MASVTAEKIRKVYPGGVVAVAGADFDVEDGELLVLVGPSGCGKTTTLRMIAGLETITSGTLKIGDRIVNDVEPKDRDIAMVFQNYALYPHMTVAENLGFGLKLRGESREEIAKRVKESADLLELGPYLDRLPRALSGGQRQRVALGRALVRSPQVYLLDEPLSNLDAKLRLSTRQEIARLHRRVQTTMIYVTHDQIEAMTLGQRIVVFKTGEIQQIDTPMNLYRKPANAFVAGFLGSPAMNLFRGKLIRADGLQLQVGDARFPLGTVSGLDKFVDQELIVGYPSRRFEAGRRRAAANHGATRCHRTGRQRSVPASDLESQRSRRACADDRSARTRCVADAELRAVETAFLRCANRTAHRHRMSTSMTRRELLARSACGLGAIAFMPRSAFSAQTESRMMTRSIPATNEALPVIGLGTYRVLDVQPDSPEYRELPGVLDALFAAGGSVIDSSPMYGRAEETAGELLAARNLRSKAFIATKVWTQGKQAGIAQMENSFRLLRTDRIDLMQIHNLVDWRTHLPTLRQWKEQGRIRYIGITHYTSSAYDAVEAALKAESSIFCRSTTRSTIAMPKNAFCRWRKSAALRCCAIVLSAAAVCWAGSRTSRCRAGPAMSAQKVGRSSR